jgi:hypothetical protein
MSEVAEARYNIQEEEVGYRAAVSEATGFKIAAAINFINNKQHLKFDFGLAKADVNSGSPTYSFLTVPLLMLGTPEIFPYNCEIVGVECYHAAAGSSGTTEIDIKWAAAGSAVWASIFSTTPKVTSVAAANVQFDTFGNATTPAGCTVPVLSKTSFAAGDKLKCDLISVMGGTPNGFLVTIVYRPR